MKKIINSLIEIKKKELDLITAVNGNSYLPIALGEIKTYADARDGYFKGRKGSHKEAPFWHDRKYIIHLITELYRENGEEYGSVRSLELCLIGCFTPTFGVVEKQVGDKKVKIYKEKLSMFFETKIRGPLNRKLKDGVKTACKENKIHWIDTLSALNKYTALFGGEGASFSEFLKNYSSTLETMNNRKIEAFYPRSIDDICAVYTIFTHHTTSFFKKMRETLLRAREEGRGRERSGAIGETKIIREHFVSQIFSSHEKGDEDKVIASLADYVREHPQHFETDRHYFAIKELLEQLILPRGIDLGDSELVKIFTSESAYTPKERNIRRFEYTVYKYLEDMCDDKLAAFELLLGKNLFADDTDRMIVSLSNAQRTLSASAENTLKLLRFVAMMLEVKRGEDASRKQAWQKTSKKTVRSNIRFSLSALGVKALTDVSLTNYTEGCEFDWCLVRYIDTDPLLGK